MSDGLRSTFRQNLIRLMEEKDLTQLDLAKAIDVSNTTINNWVLGYNIPKMHRIDDLCRIFGVSRSELIGEPQEAYFSNPETQKIAEAIYHNKELRLLFDAAKDADPEDLEFVHEWLLHRKEQEHNRDVE